MKCWFYFLLKVGMGRGRRLRKSGGGELEVGKQNVVTSDQAVIEQNVVASDQAIIEQIVVASNQAIAEQNVVVVYQGVAK
jgi:hypothetical protein